MIYITDKRASSTIDTPGAIDANVRIVRQNEDELSGEVTLVPPKDNRAVLPLCSWGPGLDSWASDSLQKMTRDECVLVVEAVCATELQ